MDPQAKDATRPRLRTRRSPLWLVTGILLVCLGGLTSAFVYLSVAASDPVLRVNRTIHRGETIRAEDLSVVSVGAGVDVRTVAEERVGEVVGRAAVSDIPGGGLLVEGAWGDEAQPLGSARVGVRLAPGRYPSTDLRPGTPMLVVALPDAAAGGGSDLPGSVAATLVAAPVVQPDGSSTVDLFVPTGQAELVARLASTDRAALVQQGTGR